MKCADSRYRQNAQLNSKLDFGVTSTCPWLLKKGCYWHCSRHMVYLWSLKCVLWCILTTNIFHRLKQNASSYCRKERHVTSKSSREKLTEIFQILTVIEILVFAHNSWGTNALVILKNFKNVLKNFYLKIFKECIQRETGLFHVYMFWSSASTFSYLVWFLNEI